MPNLVMFKDQVVQCMTGRSYSFKARQPIHVSVDDVATCKEKGAMDEDEAQAIIGAIKGEETAVVDETVDETAVVDEAIAADEAPAAAPTRRSRS